MKRKGRKILESYDPEKRKKSKINPHSIFWMVASMALFYYTDFYIAVRIDPRIDWFVFFLVFMINDSSFSSLYFISIRVYFPQLIQTFIEILHHALILLKLRKVF